MAPEIDGKSNLISKIRSLVNMIDYPRQFRQHCFGLRQNTAHRSVLKIWRIAVFPQDAFHEHSQTGSGAVAVGPVDADVGLETLQKFMGDDFQLIISKHIDRALVVGQCVIKGDFFGRQAGFLAPASRVAHLLGQGDK